MCCVRWWTHSGRLLLSLSFFLSILLIQPDRLPAQSALPAGARVRVTEGVSPPLATVGTLKAWDQSSLILETSQPPSSGVTSKTIPLDRVQRVEISEGIHARTWTGALIGGTVGALGSVLVVSAGRAGCSDCDPEVSWGTMVLLVGGVGAVVAGGIGAIIGSQVKSERWKPIEFDRYTVGVLPMPDRRLSVAVTVQTR